MLRRLPVLPTVVVLIAVGIMLRLGFWQLDRLREKEALLAKYQATSTLSASMPFPRTAGESADSLYRRATVDCRTVLRVESVSGRSAKNESGISHIAVCVLAEGYQARIVLGWSRDPALSSWAGGSVQGIIAPGPRLIVDPPISGLQANAVPNPRDIPNNHLAYAVQWFLFAGVALVIYVLAVRKKLGG